MKRLLNYILGIFTLMGLFSCANGKKLQNEGPMPFQQAYYQIHKAQDDSNASRINLYIPVADFDQTEIELDSVYFRGRKAEILASKEEQGLYVAYFEIPGKAKEFVMHADPKKEYGNTVPILEKIPFELKNDEAMLVYTRNGNTFYFKLREIAERRSGDRKIKKPENIRH